MLRRRRVLGWMLWAALIATATTGCGGKTPKEASGTTPTDTALAFAKALQQGKPELAAAYWAYDVEARAQNEDWSSIPAGQRNEIIAKERDGKVTELKVLMPALQAAKGDLQASAQDVSVTVSAGGAAVLVVTCAKSKSGYKILTAQAATR